jgi:hypothetical protein
MKVTIEIKTCRACHHVDHSGGFTMGGARTICGHSDACKVRKSENEFKGEYPEYHKRGDYDKDWKYHWFNRIVGKKIPSWCPVKNGSPY